MDSRERNTTRDGARYNTRSTTRNAASNMARNTARDTARNATRNTAKNTRNTVRTRQHQEGLSPSEEEFLAERVIEGQAMGIAPSHDRVLKLANAILHMNGGTNPVDELWVSNFIRRTPFIAAMFGMPCETDPTLEQRRVFFKIWESVGASIGIQLKDAYINMCQDEMSIQIPSTQVQNEGPTANAQNE